MKSIVNKLKLLGVLFVYAGCNEALEIPNVEVCVGTITGGFCKFTVTGEERFVDDSDLESLLWDEGGVIMSAESFGEYLKLVEKVCNRQPDSCSELEDTAKSTIENLKMIKNINHIKSK
jgi:hypothetical protein